MVLKTSFQLLDSLGTDTLDAQQLIFSVTNQVSHGLDACFRELVRPTLRDSQIIIDVETCLFIGKILRTITCSDRCEVARIVRTAHVIGAIERPILRLRQQLFDLAQCLRSGIRQTIGIVRGDRHTFVGDIDIFVALKACTSRDRLADDDILLEALQRIDLTLDRSIGENLGGLLERCSGKE